MPLSPALLPDILAFTCFMISLFGYHRIARALTTRHANLIAKVSQFRELWMRRVCERETHIADATLLSNLLRGALFFASTTVFILGGLLAIIGTGKQVADVINAIPFAAQSEMWLQEMKAFVLIMLFVYAFFKFTWSAWQYNVLSILVGAAPSPATTDIDIGKYASCAARVAMLAGDSYNNGIRAYYFSIPLFAWFISPWLFLAVTLIVTFVMYRREFASPMLATLSAALEK